MPEEYIYIEQLQLNDYRNTKKEFSSLTWSGSGALYFVSMSQNQGRKKHTLPALPSTGRTPKRVKDTIIRLLLLIVLIPRTSITIARESIRHPRVLISPIPNRNTNTALRLRASPNKARIVRRLLRQLIATRRRLHTNIHLSVRDFNTKRGVRLQGTSKVFLAGCLADGEVTLETDTVDLSAVGLHQFDNSLSGICLVTTVLDAVVVVVELDVGIGSGGGFEGDGDVRFTDVLVEDVFAV